MKLKEYLKEADVIQFKSQRQADLEKEVDQVASIIMKYLKGLALLEKKLAGQDSPANDVVLDVIGFHITDIVSFLKNNWPVDYKGLKRYKLRTKKK